MTCSMVTTTMWGLEGQPGDDSIGEFEDDDDQPELTWDWASLSWSRSYPPMDPDLLDLNMTGRDDRMDVDSTPEADGLRRMKPIVVDSGAEESVMDPEDAPGYTVTESAGSRRGAKYVGPGGERIPNKGQQRIQLMLKGGRRSNFTFNSAEVRKPLLVV